jgi:hypothetical protein
MTRVYATGKVDTAAKPQLQLDEILATVLLPPKILQLMGCLPKEGEIPIDTVDELTQFLRRHSGGVSPSDQSSNAGSGNVVHRDSVLLEPLEHTEVREPTRAASTQSQPDP